MTIAIGFWNLAVRLPSPTQVVGAPHEVISTGGKVVTRSATVIQRPSFAVLDFAELPGGWKKNGVRGGELTILVRLVAGVSTVDQARAHYFLEYGPKHQRGFEKHPDAMSTHHEDGFDVVTFNSASAGWTPGNAVQYLLLKQHEGALLLEPTHYLAFDWSRVEITKPR